jgi:hypothetical protein
LSLSVKLHRLGVGFLQNEGIRKEKNKIDDKSKQARLKPVSSHPVFQSAISSLSSCPTHAQDS